MSDFAPSSFIASPDEELTPHRQLRRRIGSALREITERLIATDAPDEDLERAAGTLELTAQALRGYAHGRVYQHAEASTSGGGAPEGHLDYSPVLGLANPLAPPLKLVIEGNHVIGTVTYGSAYEGPPGHVHGGMVAAGFDEVMGAAQALTGHPGMTGTLTIRYEAPTPLRQELRFDAWVDKVEGRKIFVRCELYNGDVRCAQSDAVFISVDFARLAAMEAARNAEDN